MNKTKKAQGALCFKLTDVYASSYFCDIVATELMAGCQRDSEQAEAFFWLVTQNVMHFNLTTFGEITGLLFSKSNNNAPKLNLVQEPIILMGSCLVKCFLNDLPGLTLVRIGRS